MAVIKKSTTVWDGMPNSLVEAHQRLEEHTAGIFEVEASKQGKMLADWLAL
jgi:hypothetical protein